MPMDRGVVDQQLQELGEGSRWWDVREMRDLPAVLHGDERILAIGRGKIARVRWLRRAWLIVVTDQRLLCMRSGKTGTWRQLEVPASQIERVTLRIGPVRGRVLMVAGGRKYRLLAPRPEAHRLLSALSMLSAQEGRSVVGFRASRAVRQALDHMLALPAVALGPQGRPAAPAPPPELRGLEHRVESLETQLQAVQQQVEFLEQLLRERHALPGATDAD